MGKGTLMVTPDETNHENAKTLFDAAVQFTLEEGNFVWSRFSAVMVAQSIIAFVFGQAFLQSLQKDSSALEKILAVGFSIVLILGGILLCQVWKPITVRSFGYQEMYLLSARELADNYLKISDPGFAENFLKKGDEFGHSRQPVKFAILNDPQHKTLEMPRDGKMTGKDAALHIISLFKWFYILAFVVTLIYLGVLVAPYLPK